tara:strand:- start:65 stop:289 length:225 start_codon:yes stop_codon:yes gene_type:complete
MAKSLILESSFIGSGFFDLKNIFYILHFISFLIFSTWMEIIIYSPNFYLHIQDAVVFVQYCIEGLVEIASQIRL